MSKQDKGKGKGTEGAVATTIDLDVTPTYQSGDIVLCDIDGTNGPNFTDGVVFVAPAGSYVMNFTLKNGPLGQYNWDTDPFWARRAKCPTGAGCPPQFSKPTVSGKTLTFAATGVPGKSAIHFRLNLKDPKDNSVFCDPIMINT